MIRINTINSETLDDDYKFYTIKHCLNGLTKNSDNRPHMKYLYVPKDLKTIACTDAKRINISDNVLNWEHGFYEILKNNKNEIWLIKTVIEADYPDYSMYINNNLDYFNCGIGLFTPSEVSRVNYNIIKKFDIVINFDFLKKAIEYLGYYFLIAQDKALICEHNQRPLIIKNQDSEPYKKISVIMPLCENK
jgi:hypothetical protein